MYVEFYTYQTSLQIWNGWLFLKQNTNELLKFKFCSYKIMVMSRTLHHFIYIIRYMSSHMYQFLKLLFKFHFSEWRAILFRFSNVNSQSLGNCSFEYVSGLGCEVTWPGEIGENWSPRRIISRSENHVSFGWCYCL